MSETNLNTTTERVGADRRWRAMEAVKERGKLWSLLRSIMAQGGDILNDLHDQYDRYVARMDAAASERADDLWDAMQAERAAILLAADTEPSEGPWVVRSLGPHVFAVVAFMPIDRSVGRFETEAEAVACCNALNRDAARAPQERGKT